ncbi:undecaprenyldiphospho-muramoylpentapeptide beta-N-acetylglucosaminyltransferase [Glaciecola siphonariae]|uniref:UDP-N-acetylglucosamine--N-acetylmuramyl-(pentapeptide) pyrophosphoryl-undecaprenol N-acetylglucosamine transferase n=1 Tax=Glaciecola siphonariae TaxID=521012 RepID=A0ABV9LWD7_9ALTE
MSSIVIMAGGTGGHVFPGLAVADELSSRGWTVNWFGTADKMEAATVPKYGYPIHFIDIAGVRGKGLTHKLMTPFKLVKAVIASRRLLKKLKPKVVLGMGGYASGPGAIAAYTLGIPLVLHEQNAIFGLTNRYLSKLAALVLCGFNMQINRDHNKAPASALFVGNPIRRVFADIPEKVRQSDANDKCEAINILIVGGSLGALALNQIVPKVLKDISSAKVLNVWHQSGKGKAEPVKEAYQALFAQPLLKDTEDFASAGNASEAGVQVRVSEFIDKVESAYAWADIVICRAGALTVAEVSAAGRVAVFVPLPIAVDDHQTFNAQNLSEQGAAILIQQHDLAEQLPVHLHRLVAEPSVRYEIARKAKSLAQMNATRDVADYCASLIGNGMALNNSANDLNKVSKINKKESTTNEQD